MELLKNLVRGRIMNNQNEQEKEGLKNQNEGKQKTKKKGKLKDFKCM